MSTDRNKNWLIPLYVAIITAVAAVSGSYFAFKGANSTAEASQLTIFIESQIKVNQDLMTEIKTLKTENSNLQLRLFKTQMEMLELEARLRATVSKTEVLQSYLEAMPVPSWIKIPREDGSFEMAFMNEQYTAAYGTTKKEYVGNTDFDIHPQELATLYQASDTEVAVTGKDIRFTDVVFVDGVLKKVEVVKFQIKLPSGVYGIGGMVIGHYDDTDVTIPSKNPKFSR
jgi:PAS domain-containing protein